MSVDKMKKNRTWCCRPKKNEIDVQPDINEENDE
jgi:hypothetical protein